MCAIVAYTTAGGIGMSKGDFMKKSIIYLACIILILSSNALANESYVVKSPNQSKKMLEKLEISESMQDEFDEVKRQIKENGYYHTYSENAVNLIAFKDKKAFAISEKGSDPYFKNLRLSPSEFKMTFPFNGISSVDDEHIIGFAPGGSIVGKNLDDGRWTGIAAFFNDDYFGTCKLSILDMNSLNGQSIYDSRYTTYAINKKPTVSSAKGNDESGFIYDVSWTGKRYEKELECANNKPFEKQLLQDLVRYAKKLDNDLPDTP